MKHRKVLALILAAVLLPACATIRGAYRAHVTGPWYMNHAKYTEGIAEFSPVLKEEPDNAEAWYWVGRYWLALDRPKDALPCLQRAVRLDPRNADAHFWLGVAYWGVEDWAAERAEYEKALELEPDHLSANLYLGHNALDRGQWARAVAQYDRVLALDPGQAEALFDRGVALGQMGLESKERQAWLDFLAVSPEGGMALEATDRLNALGDFTYRNVLIGARRVTLRRIAFESWGGVAPQSKPSLDLIGAMLGNNKDLKLHVVAYAAGDSRKARTWALTVIRYIRGQHPEVAATRLLPSWFGQAETIPAGNKTWKEQQSVTFVTQVP